MVWNKVVHHLAFLKIDINNFFYVRQRIRERKCTIITKMGIGATFTYVKLACMPFYDTIGHEKRIIG